MNGTPHYQQAAGFADRIEAEPRRMGVWQREPPPPEAFQSRVAFFGDTMSFYSFYQCLQFVLLERIRAALWLREAVFRGAARWVST